MNAVEAVLVDVDFEVPTSEARAATRTAAAFLDWAKKKENTLILKEFSKYFTRSLKACIGSDTLSLRTRKTRMWGLYHELRTSEELIKAWKDFLNNSIASEACPTFFQFVTQKAFKNVIKQEFEFNWSCCNASCELTHDDQCAIRYVAGCVCRNVCHKIELSSMPHKKDLILTLYEFRGNGLQSQHVSEEWVDILDRGGLWHVSDEVFILFCHIEEEVRQYFSYFTANNQ